MENRVFTLEPYIHQPTGDSAILIFELEQESNIIVSLQQRGGRARLIHPPSQHGIVEGDRKFFTVPLINLNPDHEYICSLQIKPVKEHRATSFVFGSEIIVPVGIFRTLPELTDSFHAVLFQDLHGNWPFIESVSESQKSSPDLLFFNGDTIKSSPSEEELRGFLSDGFKTSRWGELPFHYIRGNHECRGKAPELLNHFFPTKKGRYYYSFLSAGVFFLILDAGEDKADEHIEYGGLADFDAYRYEQQGWIRSQLESEEALKAAFRIVVMHIPPYSDEDWYTNHFMQREWVPLFNKGKIDLVLSGHDHIRNRVLREEWDNHFSMLVGDCDSYMDLKVKKKVIEVSLRDRNSRILKDSVISID